MGADAAVACVTGSNLIPVLLLASFLQLREVRDKWCKPTIEPHTQALRLGSNDPSPDRFCSESPKTAIERNYDTIHAPPVPAGSLKKLHFEDTTQEHAFGISNAIIDSSPNPQLSLGGPCTL